MRHDYDNGRAFGHGYASSYGPDEASSAIRALHRRGTHVDYLAGACDAVIDLVQTREELAPGCYRVRRIGGAE